MSVSAIRRSRWQVASLAVAVVASLYALPAMAGRVDTSGLQQEEPGGFDRFIVKYRDGSAESADASQLQRSLSTAASTGVAKRGGRALGLQKLRRLAAGGAEVVRADRKLDRVEAESLMRQLAADPNVEYVEVDQRMYPVLTPNDTRFSEQWGFGTTAAGINVRPAWDKSTGAGVVVAVIDTGITNHADLNANILPGYDFISDTFVSRDGNGRDSNPNDEGDWNPVAGECYAGSPVTNSSWHGTHVAGTVAAVTNNSTGVAGTAFGAKVVPVRVLGRCGGLTSDIADAITWASGGSVSGIPANANPAEVINMSLGGGGTCSATYQNAINGAVGRGTTVVVAAGNSNTNVSSAVPANCPNVVAVAATTSAGSRASFSNYGTGIDISGPGASILSTLNTGTTTPGSASYASYNGTSMAAPHVAGVVALMQAAAPSPLTPAQVESILKSTARPLPGTCSGGCGAGIANADGAVVAAQGGTPPGGGTQTYTNGTDVSIPDNNATGVTSTIAVSGRTGNAPSNAQVAVAIVHTYIGDLIVDVLAPDGSVYVLHNRTGGSADNINQTYTVNLSSEALNGSWRLRVRDRAGADVGYINSWSITF
ncbi:S8 family serine peptidase [Pseudoxanthomonas sp. SL93]|uniref:S8 family peptidase n=1 Tax=Pseudoxanthomonas sp. SL93 TaxID=2995142 RepID=UPI00226F1DD2|nr:S8 family serine peptidase [Pseudoxanthomonas sp. SL93]WAC64895.1 S8 family serine peptidase [Pseudoxanthomonas sp. SL93]